MCQVLKVSKSGYYKWLNNRDIGSTQAEKKKKVMSKIRRLFFENRKVYGSPRITRELHKEGVKLTEKTVGRYMREMNLRAIPKQKFVVTTDSKHNHPIYPNLLQRQFNPDRPNTVWTTDITYIWTSQGWLYLAVVIDLFSRKIVGWSTEKTMTKELPLRALNMAIRTRKPPKGLIHHSDRGSQYTSKDYIARLVECKMQISMSRKGNCYDNACTESFFASLKKELVYRHKYTSREKASKEIWKYIMSFYNVRRSHSTIGYVSPKEYEKMYREGALQIQGDNAA
ncbi:transposase [Alkalihalobacillus alcalophilus ATCC 27647 = CGMCC 1.3604]|nr:transposase [Alkalihalobacillus alcalophilus ATCC 27647 = CGMCC 1.3604]